MQADKRGCAKRSEARGQRRSRSAGLKPTRRQKARAWAEKSVVLLDQYDESGVLQRQYVQAGSAVFPLDGLPLLNEDTLIAILDIPVKGAKHRGVRTAAQPLRNPEACTP